MLPAGGRKQLCERRGDGLGGGQVTKYGEEKRGKRGSRIAGSIRDGEGRV